MNLEANWLVWYEDRAALERLARAPMASVRVVHRRGGVKEDGHRDYSMLQGLEHAEGALRRGILDLKCRIERGADPRAGNSVSAEIHRRATPVYHAALAQLVDALGLVLQTISHAVDGVGEAALTVEKDKALDMGEAALAAADRAEQDQATMVLAWRRAQAVARHGPRSKRSGHSRR